MPTNVAQQAKRRIGTFLQTQGFQSRASRRYLRSPRGDFAMVDFQTAHTGRGVSAFYINLGVISAPMWDRACWREADSKECQEAIPESYLGDWRDRLIVPTSLYTADGFPTDTWFVESESDVERIAQAACAELKNAVLPKMLGMFDRDNLLSNSTSPKTLRLGLIAEQGPSEELDRYIRSEFSSADERIKEAVAWARDFARRSAAGIRSDGVE